MKATKQGFIRKLGLVLSLAFLVMGLIFISYREAAGRTSADTYTYLPIIAKSPPQLVLEPIALTCGSNAWTAVWNDGGTMVTEYVLEEAHEESFSAPVIYTTTETSLAFNHSPTTDNLYYYRVRADGSWGQGAWSNTRMVVGGFLDDYSDPASGWATSNTTNGALAYNTGAYSASAKKAGLLIASRAPDVVRNGYSAEVDVQWASGSATDGLYALIFGVNADFSSYYFLAVRSGSQEFKLYFFDASQPGELRSITSWTSSGAINSGGQMNHLKVVRVGAEMQVVINGTVMGTWADSAQTGATYAGVMVSSNPSNPMAEALFDNFGLGACDAVAVQQLEIWQQTDIQPDSGFSVNRVDIDW